MAEPKPLLPPKPLEKPTEIAKAPSIKAQVSQQISKPDKNVRVPKYHLENFSGEDKED